MGLILYAKYADCLRLLIILMQREWSNKERTKIKLTNKKKEAKNGIKRQPNNNFFKPAFQ